MHILIVLIFNMILYIGYSKYCTNFEAAYEISQWFLSFKFFDWFVCLVIVHPKWNIYTKTLFSCFFRC